MCENMEEVITKIVQVEKKIIGRIDLFSEDFCKHNELEIELFNQNKLRIDKLVETTDLMKKEYRNKFKNINIKIVVMGTVLSLAIIGNLIISITN